MEAEKSTKSNIKKNYFYNMMAKLIMLLVPILVTPYLSRKFGADGNGRLSYIASIVSYFVLLANIGIETYGQRIIAVHQNDKGYLKKITLEHPNSLHSSTLSLRSLLISLIRLQ